MVQDLQAEHLSYYNGSWSGPRGPGGRSSRHPWPELAQFAPMMMVIRARDNLELSEELVVSAPKESGGCGGG